MKIQLTIISVEFAVRAILSEIVIVLLLSDKRIIFLNIYIIVIYYYYYFISLLLPFLLILLLHFVILYICTFIYFILFLSNTHARSQTRIALYCIALYCIVLFSLVYSIRHIITNKKLL